MLASVLVHLANQVLIHSAVTAIDTSGIDTICEIRKMLEQKSLKVKVEISQHPI